MAPYITRRVDFKGAPSGRPVLVFSLMAAVGLGMVAFQFHHFQSLVASTFPAIFPEPDQMATGAAFFLFGVSLVVATLLNRRIKSRGFSLIVTVLSAFVPLWLFSVVLNKTSDYVQNYLSDNDYKRCKAMDQSRYSRHGPVPVPAWTKPGRCLSS